MEGAGKLPRVDARVYAGVASRRPTFSLKPFPKPAVSVIVMGASSVRTTPKLAMIADYANQHTSCCLSFDNAPGSRSRDSRPNREIDPGSGDIRQANAG